MSPKDSSHLETLQWEPRHLADSDLMMYIRAARSIAAFTGMCDGGPENNGTCAAATDETTINALGTLHSCSYDTGQALSMLVKTPALRSIHKKWNDEDVKKFVKGMRTYGKNFFKIRKELLPSKETGDLVEYYYFWKKTPGALQNRHHRRRSRAGHKRQTTRSARDQQDEESGSASEESEGNDSEDSDPDKDLNPTNNCDNCKTTTDSLRLHNVEGKESLRCGPCLLYVKRHGEERPLTPSSHPPYLFQPVQEEEESPTPRHNMRTRRGNTTGTKGKKKESGSSPEGREESPVNGTHRGSVGRKSPSTNSTSSSSDKDSPQKKNKVKENNKENSRSVKRKSNAEKEEKPKKKKQEQERSDSESCSESGSLSGNDEGIEGDLDENNQDDLSSCSAPASPSLSLDLETPKPSLVKPEPVVPPVQEAALLQPPPPLTQIPLEASPASGQLPPVPSTLPLHPSVGAEARPPPRSRSPSPALAPAPVPPKSGDEGEAKPPPPPPPPPLASITNPYHLPPAYATPGGLFVGGPTVSGVPPPPGLVPIKKEPLSPKSAAAVVSSSGGAPRWEDVVKKEVESQVPLPPRSPHQDSKPAASLGSSSAVVAPEEQQQQQQRPVPPEVPPMAALPIPASMPLVKTEDGGMMVPPPHTGAPPYPPLLSMASLFPTSVEPPPPLTSNPPRPPPASQGGEGAGGEAGKAEEEKIEVEVESEDEDDRTGSLTPGLTPTPCSKEAHKSKHALLVKILDRGERNSCARTDLVFKPLPDSKFAKKREDRERKTSSSSHQSAKEEKPLKRAAETPPSRASVDSGALASTSTSQSSSTSFVERHTPRPSYTDTPALRQLSDIARPHNLGQDYSRHIPPGYLMGPLPTVDPIMSGYRMPMVPSVRDRLELDLEREKRERDARERELRDRELREIEMRKEMEMKPPGLDGRPLIPGSNLDPHWLEVQRRFGYPGGQLVPTPGSSATASGGHIPGVYPPASIASDLMQRERDKLERMGHPAAASLERMSAAEQRLQAERLALVDPMYRYQLAASLGNSAVTHAHTHTHAHAHTHLHLHSQQQQQQQAAQQQQQAAAAAAAVAEPPGPPPPPPLLSGAFHPLLPTHPHVLGPHLLPGADPLAGLPSGAGAPPALSGLSSSLAHSLPGHPSLLASASPRDQELLQREIYARAYMDQNLAHQLTSQAAAHHEALQRQLALERERYGPSGHLPPH